MEFDYSKLRGRIVEVYGSQKNFANAVNRSERTISLKMAGKAYFSQKEILEYVELLHIPEGEINAYFFTPKVQKLEL